MPPLRAATRSLPDAGHIAREDFDNLRGELGDLQWCVLRTNNEEGRFDDICAALERRHPHVSLTVLCRKTMSESAAR